MPAKYDDSGKEGTTGNPLVILGGAREVTPHFEMYEEDDSVLNEVVSRALKDFLPNLFEGRYEKGREAEMEWVSLPFSMILSNPLRRYLAVGYNCKNEDARPIREPPFLPTVVRLSDPLL
jgi:hypothetical protein